MSNVEGAYCALTDMRTGDISAPSYMSKEQYIKSAAEEIETALGHLYVTPFVIDWLESAPTVNPEFRPTVLFLKKVNWLLASGRFMLDVGAAGEADNINAYGKRMLDEAMMMLKPLISGEIVLAGANQIEAEGTTNSTGPTIHNEDSASLVEGFYKRGQYGLLLGETYPGYSLPSPVPYG